MPIGSVARSLVRTAQLSVDADDPVAATRRVRAAVAGAAGTVSQESSTDSGAQLTVRVPADRLDQLIDSIAGLGHVTNRTSQVVDATEDVVDLDARVASQRASVDRVRALLAQARSIGDVVAIESELTRREADLDSLTGRLNALKDQVALSTLTVDVERRRSRSRRRPQPTGFTRRAGRGVGRAADRRRRSRAPWWASCCRSCRWWPSSSGWSGWDGGSRGPGARPAAGGAERPGA